MSGRDLFGVVVRTFGFLTVLYGGYYGVFGLMDAILRESWMATDRLRGDNEPGQYLLWGAVLVAIGFVIIRNAEFIVRLSYPPQPQDHGVNPPATSPDSPTESN